MREYDAIVVGAGPAGSTAAKLLADRRRSVLLVDRQRFPRHKTCASWVNRLALERFPYLRPHLGAMMESPFYGIDFWDHALARRGCYSERVPSGYLTLRSKFDNALKDIAVAAGAEFREGAGVARLAEAPRSIVAILEDGSEFRAQVLVGADGASSRVAVLADYRKGWRADQAVLCANEDLPWEPEGIARFYGEAGRVPLIVSLGFRGLVGYGWIFPKREHICVGIGGRLGPGENIAVWYDEFFEAAQRRGLLPPKLRPERPYYALDPAGAVHSAGSLVRGRTILVGDAGGFVSGSTGEGIYPGMESAAVAVEVIDRALASGKLPEGLGEFDKAWRPVLGHYLRTLPGGNRPQATRNRIDWIFRSRLAARMAGRAFLYGEPTSLGTLWRAVVPQGGGASALVASKPR